MSNNLDYMSVSRLFPNEYVATVFGIANFFGYTLTIFAPICAELPEPIPMMTFVINATSSIILAHKLVEYD